MYISKLSMPRRTFLRGVGTAMALPLLDAMVPALTATAQTAAKPVKRFGVVYVPNGLTMAAWTPKATGAAFELTPILQPMAPFQEQMLLVSGLNGAGGFGHTGASTEFLTGIKVGTRDPDAAGPSVDQLIAAETGKETQLASLELSIDPRDNTGTCDGHSCALSNTISWRSSTVLLPMENDPRVVFERLFGDSGTTDPAVRRERLQFDRSILDSVTTAAADLQRGLGEGDRQRIVEYLDSVRDVERRIQRATEQSTRELPLVSQPDGIPQRFDEHAGLMFDLQALAFQSDLTRVSTFMLGREFSARTFPEIGVSEAHHPLSHHQNVPGQIEKITKVNTYQMSVFASHVEKLRSTPDGDGSLLDHTVMLYGAGMSEGNTHDHSNLPLMLVGGKDLVRGGRHLMFEGDPAANLLLSIADRMDVPIEQLGNSRGKLELDTLL
ncbi:MAG: hypothetical protein CL483_09560 [Acidobacteria bacterium]|jgi:hypothetical protein|nr:hypothetical protein [Acidobacteriota bacterium]|tara:strand:+ start:35 stop:1351 length:1317 start_codon:yes stop_codon:yes gene_type:complete